MPQPAPPTNPDAMHFRNHGRGNDAFDQRPRKTVSVCNLRPNSVGSGRLVSADHQDAPTIVPN